MSQELSRRSLLKLVGASGAGLTVGLVTSQKSEAAFDTSSVTASLSFHLNADDQFVFRSKFDGITASSNPDEFVIEVTLTNKSTGEVIGWQGPPTKIG